VRVKKSIEPRKAPLSRPDRVEKSRLEKETRDRRDLEIIECNAERLNRDALDTAEYQLLHSR